MCRVTFDPSPAASSWPPRLRPHTPSPQGVMSTPPRMKPSGPDPGTSVAECDLKPFNSYLPGGSRVAIDGWRTRIMVSEDKK